MYVAALIGSYSSILFCFAYFGLYLRYMETANQYEKEARRVIALVKEKFVLPDGSLLLERTGDYVFPHHIFPDLGDVAPFFLYFGESAFIDEQVRLYRKKLKNGLLVSEFPTLGLRNLVKTYEYTDLILGLLSVWEYDKTQENKRILDETVDAAIYAFHLDGTMRSMYHSVWHVRLPIIDTRDATLIECFTALYRATGEERHLKVAYSIFDQLIATPFYKKEGLFADYEPTNIFFRLLLRNNKKTKTATMCKNNTNTLFAFLDLYRITHDERVFAELERLTESVLQKVTTPEGAIGERFVSAAVPVRACLTASFPVLDYLCDLAVEVPKWRDRALRAAQGIADFWLSKRGATNLFPLYADREETFFDSETDMTVGLYKLAELTGEKRYETAADETLEGILRYHAPHDYPLAVSSKTGEVLNPTQRTKFLCLFLKVLILKIEQQKGVTVYGDAHLFELLKDR